MRILFAVLVFLSHVAGATHLRSGFITVKRTSPLSRTVAVKITVYVNTDSEIHFGNGLLSFGDGESIPTESVLSTPRPDLGPNVGKVEVTILHTYAQPGRYLVSYVEANRNAGIVNMFNSVETRFYIESLVDLTREKTPEFRFVAPAVFKATLGHPFSVGLSVDDASGYRLQYSLVVPKKELGLAVDNYRFPAGVSINPYNGKFSWDLEQAPVALQGEYGFALRVDAFDEFQRLAGYLVFDFQIILVDGGDMGGRIAISSELDGKGRVYTDDKDSVKVVLEGDAPDWQMSLHSGLPVEAVSMVTKDSTAGGKFYKVNWVRFNNLDTYRRANPYPVVVSANVTGGGGEQRCDATLLFFTEDVDFTDIITGMEHSRGDITVYPNPFPRFLTVHSTSEREVTVIIIRQTGEQVLVAPLAAGGTLDLGDLPAGFYIARVAGQSFRLIKQ